MQPVQATFSNGRLELLESVDWPDGTRAEVIPLLKTTTSDEKGSEPSQAWPADYFETTAGAFADEPLERAPQGDFPNREDW